MYDYSYRPARRNPDGIHCVVCGRIFAGLKVPCDRVCRDCRIERVLDDSPPTTLPIDVL